MYGSLHDNSLMHQALEKDGMHRVCALLETQLNHTHPQDSTGTCGLLLQQMVGMHMSDTGARPKSSTGVGDQPGCGRYSVWNVGVGLSQAGCLVARE